MAILILSVIPTREAPSVPHLDKVVHLCEYLVFAWLLVLVIRANPQKTSHHLWWAWLYATSYGWLMEVVQWMLPWRSADVADGFMNALGAALGVWMGSWRRS